jgi:hypothetical protein
MRTYALSNGVQTIAQYAYGPVLFAQHPKLELLYDSP